LRLGGKKAQARLDPDFLDWALAAFSGYVAADELYDGPFCILSAVDNRRYKRILYDVLDHDPTHDDIRAFLQRLKTALTARDLTLFGVTTDGSALYPTPLVEVFGDVPHQICTFHIVAEVNKGFCRKVRFLGKIQKLDVRNSMTYRLPNSRKSNFATELSCPRGTTTHENGPALDPA